MKLAATKPLALQSGHLPGARKDAAAITADWNFVREAIEGVRIREMKNVLKGNGDVLCEIFRRDWDLDDGKVDQIFQSVMNPGSVSAWHAHGFTTDRLFVSYGIVRVVLYDAREDSATHRQVLEYRIGAVRPALLIVPPGVWHGVQNISSTAAILLNLVDRAYQYDDPDHWRLPQDTDMIPYHFAL